ncbi:MAG: transglycosylase SLT domain-containing protein [Gemmatimonadetes bacterium]|nr:transglycosylase SLT domain-containing protein [Gemmatimonadota bacterium]
MSRRLLLGLLAALALLAVPLILLFRTGGEEGVRAQMEGDVGDAVARMDPAEMPVLAQAFLATERPWRAARVMRGYMERVRDVPADHRVLSARAEAGWGGWPEVHALLENVPALDTHENGVGLYLLGRARDERGDAAGAVDAYRAFLALSPPAGEMEEERSAARLLLGLALIRAGDREGARSELQVSSGYAGGASVWLDLLEADALAQAGDTAAVRRAVTRFNSGLLGLRAWRARVNAARHAGDIASARTLANQARGWAQTSGTRAEFFVAAGRAAIEMGDVAAGRSALRAAIDLGAAGPHARQAADLLRAGEMTTADHLALARVYRAQGLHEESIEGYRLWLRSGQGTAAEQAEVHMEHSNALFYAERYGEVEAALRPIAGQTAAQMLRARAASHHDNNDEAVRIYLSLAQRFAGTANGVQALFLAASVRHDEGDIPRGRELYGRVVSQYAGTGQMGLAMMRLAGIAFLEGDYAEAARIWDQYRSRYPRGTLALQSTYWAGRARAEMGDSAAAATLFRSVRQTERDSYYALLASERIGEPFWPLPMRQMPGDSPAAAQRVSGWMQGIDMLRAAGFPDEASAEADRVVAGAGSDRPTLYALAEALAERGYSQRAIRIGLRLQGAGPPDRRLLRILYPLPYRTLITEEARDRGLDPFITTALIRQESMFEARITSHVGARGLMQIMPATGRGLADAVGIERWDPEVLYHPEINVHLGTRYVAQHWENYDGSLPSVFSAYNAGSHRVEWWSEFPEYGNDELFTERIPFRETRDYVKILTRNHALYRGLYGADG